MTLSDAIRKGASLCPQSFGVMFCETADGTRSSCALGAAYEATFGRRLLITANVMAQARGPLEDVYPELRQGEPQVGPQLWATIIEFNDGIGLSREQIASWLDNRSE